MIQRIQSLWLILAFCGTMLLFMVPIVNMHGETAVGSSVDASLNLIAKSNPEMLAQIEAGGDVVMDTTGYMNTWWVAVLVGVTALMALVSIFMYKNRINQLRLVALTFLMNAVYVFVLLFWAVDKFNVAFQQFAQSMGCERVEMNYSIGIWVPLITIVLFVLAQRGIKKDEAKVRAADRLR